MSHEGRTVRVRPVAEYQLWGLVVSHNDIESVADIYHDSSSIDTKDLCVVWGSNLESGELDKVSFESGPWTCYYRYPEGVRFAGSKMSNNHMITDRESLRFRPRGRSASETRSGSRRSGPLSTRQLAGLLASLEHRADGLRKRRLRGDLLRRDRNPRARHAALVPAVERRRSCCSPWSRWSTCTRSGSTRSASPKPPAASRPSTAAAPEIWPERVGGGLARPRSGLGRPAARRGLGPGRAR